MAAGHAGKRWSGGPQLWGIPSSPVGSVSSPPAGQGIELSRPAFTGHAEVRVTCDRGHPVQKVIGWADQESSSAIRSAPRQPSAIVGAAVLPDTWIGNEEASMTRSPVTPRTRSRESMTSSSFGPIPLAPTAW